MVRAVRAARVHRGAPSEACARATGGRASASSAPTANCGREVVGEWRRDRNVVYYLLASAVFRDGLAGVFAFGAVLGVSVYGISNANVLLFGVSASVIAAVGALLGGLVDDRLGSKPVIVGSLASMIAVGADPDDAVRARSPSGSAGCCCACSSGRRSLRRGR